MNTLHKKSVLKEGCCEESCLRCDSDKFVEAYLENRNAAMQEVFQDIEAARNRTLATLLGIENN